jgi:hypothetical protein
MYHILILIITTKNNTIVKIKWIIYNSLKSYIDKYTIFQKFKDAYIICLAFTGNTMFYEVFVYCGSILFY